MKNNPEYKAFITPAARPVPVAGIPGLPLTPPDILGPFYRPGAPFRNQLCGYPTLLLDGTVTFEDGSPVSNNSFIEFWQADAAGQYDEHGPGFRGIQALKPDGSYHLETIRPGDYDISEPTDPQPHDFRCAHIHVKVWIDGKDVLTTQLYFPVDKYNATDHWYDASRVIRFSDANHGRFDIIIKKP